MDGVVVVHGNVAHLMNPIAIPVEIATNRIVSACSQCAHPIVARTEAAIWQALDEHLAAVHEGVA